MTKPQQDIPINFVYCNNLDNRLFTIDDVDKHPDKFISGRDVWLLQTYFLLKKYYSNITLDVEPKKDCINIIHGGSLRRATSIAGYYFVNARADYSPAHWCNFEIVQNKLQEKAKAKYITHWPQPGLIKRDKTREKIENVAFLGAVEQNILTEYPVAGDMASMGLNYISRDRERWNDFSNIDILLGIRQFGTKHIYPNKPPSKLINAWWAEVPLISGTDSAYEEIATPGQDYLYVHSYEELLDTLNHFKNNPGFYSMIVNNGIKKRERYSRVNIINDWIYLFTHEILPDFLQWKESQGIRKFIDTMKRQSLRKYQMVLYKSRYEVRKFKNNF